MVQSMTGYGKAQVQIDNKTITVEIRSLNSKQLDLSVRIPSAYRQVEYEVRNAVSKRLQRGKIDVFISSESDGCAACVSINKDMFSAYYAQMAEIASKNGIEWGDHAVSSSVIPAILRMPEVVQNDVLSVSDSEKEALMSATEQAINQMDMFRTQEGAILIADLLRRIDKIEELKNSVTPFEKQRTETIKNRIRESIESLGLNLDTNRLEQEMIYYIEKLDITEEKVRLQNHCDYFREVAHGEQGVGRKLGFISQEIGREINTMGSKSNEANMQRMVVEMKDELEKIKEQLLNIL